MSKTLLKGLLIAGLVLCLVLAAILWRRKEEPPPVMNTAVPAANTPRDVAYEAAVQSELLDCARTQGEEYVRRRDALVAKARANPNGFRSAATGSPGWEQRVLGEIVMEYVLREKEVQAFADWVPAARRMKTREQYEPIRVYGADFAKHARKVPMVLVESLWKGTNEKFRDEYSPISRVNQQFVAQALGGLKERRAREVLEWLMNDIVLGTPDSANATAARALGVLGCPESVPALLAALEKGVDTGSALERCADASSLPLLRKVAATSSDEGMRATANDLIRYLETQPREGSERKER